MNSLGHSPVLRTPLTDLGSKFGRRDIQKYGAPQCKKFEMKYIDCLDAYGVEKSYEMCKDIFGDLQECMHGFKQMWRYEQLIAERNKQYEEGKLEKKYSESPAPEVMYKIIL